MRTRRGEDDLLVESLPTARWLRALLFMGVGSIVTLVLAPTASGLVATLLLLAALAMTATGVWYALRARGDTALFSAQKREVRFRSVGLLPARVQRSIPLEDIAEVLVNVCGNPGGGARWCPVLRVGGEEVWLSRIGDDDRAACERIAAEVREWLKG